MLLVDIVYKVEGYTEARTAERKEHTEAGNRLQVAGEKTPAAFVQRVRSRGGKEKDVDQSNTERTKCPSTKPRVRRTEFTDSDEEESAWLPSQVEYKSTAFEMCLKIDEGGLAREREVTAHREREEIIRTPWEDRN